MDFYDNFVEFLLFTSLSSLTPSATEHSLRTGITHLLRVRQCHVRGLRATNSYKKCILDAHPIMIQNDFFVATSAQKLLYMYYTTMLPQYLQLCFD